MNLKNSRFKGAHLFILLFVFLFLVPELSLATSCRKAATDLFKSGSLTKVYKELNLRVAALIKKYPKNVAMVDKVQFKFNRREAVKRRVLAVTTKGLDSVQQEEFIREYLAAIDQNSVSFPLSQEAGHLYSRFNSKVYDYYSWFKKNNYGAAGSRRLEPFILLNPKETENLSTYINNVSRRRDRVLGSNSYNGIQRIEETVGTLSNNRSTMGGGHNCTSWIGLAPIGESGERLLELIGATDAIEIHTNPGWWSYFITGAAHAERVPFVIYWDSEKDIKQVVTHLNSHADKNLKWSFGRH